MTTEARRAATSSETGIAEVAMEVLGRASAVDAVVAGVLAGAALFPTVFLGPVQLLVGGAGAGLRAVDGRTRQPGFGQQRPRGFVEEREIAPAARVPVPTLPAALAVALGTFGTTTLGRCVGPAIELSRSPERTEMLRRFGRLGPAVLTERSVAEELVAQTGRVAGGLLGLEDLERVYASVVACQVTRYEERSVARAPWGEVQDARHTCLVAAADGRGLVAIACFEASEEGVELSELGLVAPFGAAPVRRGVERVRPGEPCPAPSPMALVEREGASEFALGWGRSAGAEAALRDLLRRGTYNQDISEGVLVGVWRSRDGARPIRRASCQASSDAPSSSR